METLDWSLIRSFLAVAEAGSLSAAARATGISQPSLGRHIAAAEAALGTRLFLREAAAARLSLAATAQNTAMTGTVRITASRIVAAHILPPILARLRQDEPGIQLEVAPDDTVQNLLYHAADLAIRMVRSTQGDLIARRVATMQLGLYAARSLIERMGQPTTPDELLQMDFVGFDQSDQILRMMAEIGQPVDRNFFPLRCDDQLVHLALVRAGCGVSGIPVAIGDADPLLQRIHARIDLPNLPVWLVAAPGLRETPRIARVWDALATGLAESLGPA
jgi:DNA-binding transcriptional LysR family regulator